MVKYYEKNMLHNLSKLHFFSVLALKLEKKNWTSGGYIAL